MIKLCPKCRKNLNENIYFGKWMCSNPQCNYDEWIKNNDWIEPIKDVLELYDLPYKLNEIISVLNKITNPKVIE